MSDIVTLVRNYINVWNITDPATRRAAIDAYLTEDVEYVDPNAAVQGKSALDSYIQLTQGQLSGLVFSLSGEVSTHHSVARFTWHIGYPGDGAPVAVGCDFAEIENSKIRRLYGFFSLPQRIFQLSLDPPLDL